MKYLLDDLFDNINSNDETYVKVSNVLILDKFVFSPRVKRMDPLFHFGSASLSNISQDCREYLIEYIAIKSSNSKILSLVYRSFRERSETEREIHPFFFKKEREKDSGTFPVQSKGEEGNPRSKRGEAGEGYDRREWHFRTRKTSEMVLT